MADRGPSTVARDRLHAVLAAYGTDPARWPQGDRELALLLTTPDPALTASLEDAHTLDSVLAQASHPAVPAAAADRVVARVNELPTKVLIFTPREQAPNSRRATLPRWLAVPTALAASLALGLYLGASGQGDWLTSPLLADKPQEYLSAELDVLDGTLELFEDQIEQ